MDLEALIKRNREGDKRDLEKQLKRGEPEDAACEWCGSVFRSRGWDKADKAYFMRDCRKWGHGICRQRHEEIVTKSIMDRR